MVAGVVTVVVVVVDVVEVVEETTASKACRAKASAKQILLSNKELPSKDTVCGICYRFIITSASFRRLNLH